MKNNNNLYDYLIANENDKDQKDKKGVINESRSFFISKIRDLNIMLTMNGLSELGDLYNSTNFSVGKTLKTVQILLEDRQRATEAKSSLVQRLNKFEIERQNYCEKIDELTRNLNETVKKNKNLMTKLAQKEKDYVNDLKSLSQEKEELVKALNLIKIKESQFKHENKKIEIEMNDLKSKLKKQMTDEKVKIHKIESNNNLTFINTTGEQANNNNNLNSNLHISNFNNRWKEFYDLLYFAYNENIKILLKENEEYKNNIKSFQKDILNFIDLKRIILGKISKNSVEEIKMLNPPNIIIEKILGLNACDNREILKKNMNDLLKSFRNFSIYDTYRVNPNEEFDFNEIANSAINRKYEFGNIPFYQEISKILSTFDFQVLENQAEYLLKNFSIKDKEILEKIKNEQVKNEKDGECTENCDEEVVELPLKNKMGDFNDEIIKSIEKLSIID